MQEEIDLSTQDFTYAQAIQLVGQAFTCLALLPLIRKYGRRPTCIVSSAVVCACSWWSVYMKSVPEVYLYNFIMGMAAEVNEATVQLSVRICNQHKRRGQADTRSRSKALFSCTSEAPQTASTWRRCWLAHFSHPWLRVCRQWKKDGGRRTVPSL